MAKSPKKSIYLKETSKRSGFDNWSFDGTTFHKKWTGIKDKGFLIAPEEIDTPPPSSVPLGGADITGTPRTGAETTTIPSVSAQVIQYVTAAGGISLNTQPWIMIAGSNTAVDITANPQIQAGKPQQIISVQCVGSSVTLEEGSGLALIAGKTFVMQSGSIINYIWSGTDSLWHETSRVQNGGI